MNTYYLTKWSLILKGFIWLGTSDRYEYLISTSIWTVPSPLPRILKLIKEWTERYSIHGKLMNRIAQKVTSLFSETTRGYCDCLVYIWVPMKRLTPPGNLDKLHKDKSDQEMLWYIHINWTSNDTEGEKLQAVVYSTLRYSVVTGAQ